MKGFHEVLQRRMLRNEIHGHRVELAGRHERYADGVKQREQHKKADDQVDRDQCCFLDHFLSFCFRIHRQVQRLQFLCRIRFRPGNRCCYSRH